MVVDQVDVDQVDVMGNYWLKRKMSPLDRVCVRRGCMYIEKRARVLLREKLHTGAPDYWLQAKLKEMMDELRTRGLFTDYEMIVTDELVMIGIQPRDGFPWINIEMELKMNESENEDEQFLAGQEERS